MSDQSVDTARAPVGLAEPVTAPAAPDHAEPTARRGTRNTVVLLVFTAITNLADGVTKIALPLLAARASASPAQVSAVSLTLSLPWLLAALHVGVLVDRLDRRRLLWGANGLRLTALGALMPLAAADAVTIPVLCAAGLVLGVAEVIALTSASAMIPALTPPEGRERANTWIAGAETVCNEFAGPFVGGLLLAAGTGVALGTTWLSYLAASLVVVLLVGRFRASRRTDGRADAETAAPETVRVQIVDGLSYLWRHTLLRTMALILTVLCACWGAWLALMPLFATSVMHLSPSEYGTLLSALGVGGLAGALAVTWLNRFFGRRWVMFADLVGTFAMMAVPAVTTNLWAVAVAAFLGGMGGTLWTVNARTMAQRLVPDAMLGRFGAVSRLFSWGAMPIGAGLMGLLAEWFGLRLAFGFFAVTVALTVPPFLRVLTRSALAEAFGDKPRA
ncbi:MULTISPECIES: MFS transporter [unclassified Streptomyces]|uniref:MFS transporter n=1 Tax=unclassified Streptomyces TaxID=2593676 RepID=UPI000DBA2200|nr:MULTISPECIES: MFS transporter [unclassified Streptomyces]MYT75236.1 MFS transporter [Streptomyces sp. SID8367]RAJ77192.1 Na+/melibiose symporter-like transporter [Streptomyces sp. PsTaAH-137]